MHHNIYLQVFVLDRGNPCLMQVKMKRKYQQYPVPVCYLSHRLHLECNTAQHQQEPKVHKIAFRKQNLYLGVGGKLGTMAFGGVILSSLIYWLVV